jgi:alpha-L-fucosidase 2
MHLADRTFPNLLTWQPPFQVDGTFGALAGVVEMLLQSHEGFIELLPALPTEWDKGSYEGLVARGNFVVGIEWKRGKARTASVTAGGGGLCQLAYPGIKSARVYDADGERVAAVSTFEGNLQFETTPGATYKIRL